jgi:hypothetical protein
MNFRTRMMSSACFSAEGVGTGGNPAVPPVVTEPATFSVDYVRELRGENKGYRLKLTEVTTKLEAAEKAAAEKVSAAEAKAAEAVSAAGKRIVASELKVAAKAAGLMDMDFLKLLDTSVVKLKDDGDVEIPADFWEKAKAAKPAFFTPATGAEKGTTAPTATPPKPGQVPVKTAKEMTPAEYAAAKAALGA